MDAATIQIPPASLRFMAESDADFLPACEQLAGQLLRQIENRPDLRLLDVGCGYGRLAYGLQRAGFRGQYSGFDILSDHIGWLRQHFPAMAEEGRYRFQFANVYNERYNAHGQLLAQSALPFADERFDAICTISVFTHMYREEVELYMARLCEQLEEGGIWLLTFFALPRGFSMEHQSVSATFRMQKQLSEHVFIHKESEPLYVVAYTEEFLEQLFARHGLELLEYRSGQWRGDGEGEEFQDWYVLRKTAPSLPASRLAEAACAICGGVEFGPGPGGRMAASGAPPCCRHCGALERQRILRRIFHALPLGLLDWRRGLQFSPDPAIDGGWFRHYEVSVYGQENSLDLQALDRPDASYDFLSLNHVLEFIPDDRKAFAELLRVMSPRAVLQLCLSAPDSREFSEDYAEPSGPHGAWHLYGGDFMQRFQCAEQGLSLLVVSDSDPCTGTRETVHLLFRDGADAARWHASLLQWGGTLQVLPAAAGAAP